MITILLYDQAVTHKQGIKTHLLHIHKHSSNITLEMHLHTHLPDSLSPKRSLCVLKFCSLSFDEQPKRSLPVCLLAIIHITAWTAYDWRVALEQTMDFETGKSEWLADSTEHDTAHRHIVKTAPMVAL